MTVTNLDNRVTYLGNSIATDFAFPFRIFQSSDLTVTLRTPSNVETVLVEGVDYTVYGVNQPTGGLILLPLSLVTGYTLTLERVLTLTQPTDYRNQGQLLPETIEDELDRGCMIDQQLQTGLDRTLQFPVSLDPDSVSGVLPVPAANQFLAWNSTGSQLTNVVFDAAGDVILPGDGRTVASLTNYLGNNAVFNVRDYGAVGDGVADDWAAILATYGAAVNASAFFPPGTYRISTNLSAGVPMILAPGAILAPDVGITLTITEPFQAALTQCFAGAGSVVFDLQAVEAVYPEWWYNFSGDWHDAILAAINSLPAFPGVAIPLRFQPATYTTSRIIVPTVGGASRAACWEGVGGGGANRKAKLSFTSTPGAGVGQLDLSGCTSTYPTIRNLNIVHASGVGAAVNGVGVKLSNTNSTYATLEDLWVAYFDYGISSIGWLFYSTFNRVRCHYNYSYGLYLNSALLNGTQFRDCQFSNTVNGEGAYVFTPGQAVGFHACHFEGNSASGMELSQADQCLFDNCYFEANGTYDLYAHAESFASRASLVTLRNCYFDPDVDKNHYRIRHHSTRLSLENCRLYDSNGLPPIQTVLTGGSWPIGSTPNIAKNCEYYTATLSTDDRYWELTDSKNPRVGFVPNDSSQMNVKAGTLLLNTDEATLPTIAGHLITTSGYLATVPTITVTATTTATSNVVAISSNTNNIIRSGDKISIAGVDFGGGAATYATVVSCISGPSVVLDLVCNQTVAAAAITFRAATKVLIPTPLSGTWTPSDGSGAGLTFTTVSGRYIRNGQTMHVWGELTYPSTASGSSAQIAGLPVVAANITPNSGGAIGYTSCTNAQYIRTVPNSSTLFLYDTGGANTTNAQMSLKVIDFSATYQIA